MVPPEPANLDFRVIRCNAKSDESEGNRQFFEEIHSSIGTSRQRQDAGGSIEASRASADHSKSEWFAVQI